VVICLLTLLVPLLSLTTHHATLAHPGAAQPATNPQTRIHLELTSTTVPFHYQVGAAGRTIWSGESNAATVATDQDLMFPREGIDLVLDVSWNEEKQTAVRLAVTPRDADPIAKTVWGTSKVSEVLTFQEER
jgi:hypothetical protein